MRANRFLMAKTSILVVMLFLLVPDLSARERTLYTFPGGDRGGSPDYGIAFDASGNAYGTTPYYGSYGWGTVYRLKKTKTGWHQEVIHDFLGGTDGYEPTSNLLIGPDGTIYGTTLFGGTGSTCENGDGGCGTAFALVPSRGKWKHTVLYNFCSRDDCSDGANPYGLSFDGSGNVLGVAGGASGCECAVVFELTRVGKKWRDIVLHTFGNQGDGIYPNPGLVVDRMGNIYGTTSCGGSYGDGTVFELKSPNNKAPHAWKELILYNFTGAENDSIPNTGLVIDPQGNFYGTTIGDYQSCTSRCGSVYELSFSQGVWMKNTVYAFSGKDGDDPNALLMDQSGHFYGSAVYGGKYNDGVIFELTPGTEWTINILYNVTGKEGKINPNPGLVLGSDSGLYGTTPNSNQYYGTVFEVLPGEK